jgi:hypothetical protein
MVLSAEAVRNFVGLEGTVATDQTEQLCPSKKPTATSLPFSLNNCSTGQTTALWSLK